MRVVLAGLLVTWMMVFISGCTGPDIDDEKPFIDLSEEGAFPRNCDTLYLGESFIFKIRFLDNVALGAFSIDIHQNFDHHSHSTEVTQCEFSPVKVPVNPFQFTMDYEIPEGLTEFDASVEILIPAEKDGSDLDEGDYHFFIRLTDKEGWSAQKGLSIKILKRE